MGAWANITKGELRRLSAEVLRRMTQYRAELKVFSSFVEKVAEAPFMDPIYDEPLSSVPLVDRADKEGEEEDSPEIEAVVKPNKKSSAAGGEIPWPTVEW